MQRMKWFSAIAATAAAGMLAGMLLVPRGSLTAQAQQGPPPPGAGRPGPGPMGPGQMPPGMMMRMPGAIAATETHVYVLRGNTLYQFSARDLGTPRKVTLEEPEMPAPGAGGRPGRPGAGPGGPPPAP